MEMNVVRKTWWDDVGLACFQITLNKHRKGHVGEAIPSQNLGLIQRMRQIQPEHIRNGQL